MRQIQPGQVRISVKIFDFGDLRSVSIGGIASVMCLDGCIASQLPRTISQTACMSYNRPWRPWEAEIGREEEKIP